MLLAVLSMECDYFRWHASMLQNRKIYANKACAIDVHDAQNGRFGQYSFKYSMAAFEYYENVTGYIQELCKIFSIYSRQRKWSVSV